MLILLLLNSFITVLLTQGYYFWRLSHLKGKAHALIENKVDDVLDTLKHEIPMAATFLRGPLEEKLRDKAKHSVQSLLPEGIKMLGSPLSWVILPYMLAALLAWAISMMLQ